MRCLLSQLLILAATWRSSKAYDLPLNCAPNNVTMSTPTYGLEGALFTVCAQNIIHSSPPPIYDVLIDFPRYPAWNTFVYLVDLPANVSSAKDVYVGMLSTFHTDGLFPAGLNSTSDETMTYLEPDNVPPFVGWRLNEGIIGDLLFQAEHISVLWDLENGTTKYVSWETYYGPLALVNLLLRSNLQTEFENQGRDLKTRVERLQS
jgi:hypothetical protein